ncbi:MAG: zinc-binding dehydrogenase [Balneolaceae bacterium]|nr:zinc-binding dehydrogenase [Balneolaceae bacterium]
MQNFCTVPEDMAMPIPENLSFEEAAAIPETFLTAYQALKWVGTVQNKETVLIHAAGSGVGTSAIQLCKNLFNTRILATAGKERKLKAAEKLGADFTYNYQKVDFPEAIESDIGSDEIDLIVDFIGGSYWNQNMSVLAQDGRLVILYPCWAATR